MNTLTQLKPLHMDLSHWVIYERVDQGLAMVEIDPFFYREQMEVYRWRCRFLCRFLSRRSISRWSLM